MSGIFDTVHVYSVAHPVPKVECRRGAMRGLGVLPLGWWVRFLDGTGLSGGGGSRWPRDVSTGMGAGVSSFAEQFGFPAPWSVAVEFDAGRPCLRFPDAWVAGDSHAAAAEDAEKYPPFFEDHVLTAGAVAVCVLVFFAAAFVVWVRMIMA